VNRVARPIILFGAMLLALACALAWPVAQLGWGWFDVQWQSPWFALALPLAFALIWAVVAADRRRPRLKIGTVSALAKGPRGARVWLRDVPGALRPVAFVFLVGALCRPVAVLEEDRGSDEGIDIILTIDLSGSMRAVLDGDASQLPGATPPVPGQLVPGQPAPTGRLNRLDTAKVVVRDFIARRKTDRIGSVVFGKSAFVLSPPTLDYHLLSQLVSKLTLSVIDGSGTAIGDALAASVARLRRSDAATKVVILLTDGDSNAGSVSPDFAAKLAVDHGVKIYTIQLGNGDEVDVQEGVDLFGQPRYVRQKFPVNPELLQRISKATGGSSYVATDGKELAKSMHAVLDQLEKTRFEAARSSYLELFHLLLVPGVILIGLEVFLRAFLLRRFP
jgi:Ca-activated chloride channel family protein